MDGNIRRLDDSLTEEIEVFDLQDTYADVLPDATPEEVMLALDKISAVERAIQWWIGDIANFMESRWPDRYEQLIEASGYKLDTLYTYAYVSRQYPRDVRRADIPFSVYQAAASLPALETRMDLVNQAAEAAMSVRQVRKAAAVIRGLTPGAAVSSTKEDTKGKVDVIYVPRPDWAALVSLQPSLILTERDGVVWLFDPVDRMAYRLGELRKLVRDSGGPKSSPHLEEEE